MLEVACVKVLSFDQSKDAAWGTNDNCRWLGLKLLDVCRDGLTSIHDFDGDLFFIHVLGEAVVLLLDLESEFSGVAHNED